MKLGKPWIEASPTTSRSTGKTTNAWRVRWYVTTPDGKRHSRKQGGFVRKGQAEVFIETLRHASLNERGWTFDTNGHPVQNQPPTEQAETVLDTLEHYCALHWTATWHSPRTREKNRNRLLVLAALALDDPQTADLVLTEFVKTNGEDDTKPKRSTNEAKAARYLREHALDPSAQPLNLTPEHEAAKRWLEEHSIPIEELDDALLAAFRQRFAHLSRSTQRTYWSVIAGYLTWLTDSGRLDRNPSSGMPRIKRDLAREEVDPEQVPSETEILTLANHAERRWGIQEKALFLTLYYAAIRIGEAAGLRRSDIEIDERGHGLITVREQHQRETARYNEGSTHRDDSPKGRTSGPGARRTIPIPSWVAEIVFEHIETNQRQPTDRLFTQPKGGPLNPDTFRRSRWNVVVADVFGAGHRLENITPHACRHGGMTRWLRQRLHVKTIQRFGGWESLKVMLDTYAAVMPDDLEEAIPLIDTPPPA